MKATSITVTGREKFSHIKDHTSINEQESDYEGEITIEASLDNEDCLEDSIARLQLIISQSLETERRAYIEKDRIYCLRSLDISRIRLQIILKIASIKTGSSPELLHSQEEKIKLAIAESALEDRDQHVLLAILEEEVRQANERINKQHPLPFP